MLGPVTGLGTVHSITIVATATVTVSVVVGLGTVPALTVIAVGALTDVLFDLLAILSGWKLSTVDEGYQANTIRAGWKVTQMSGDS